MDGWVQDGKYALRSILSAKLPGLAFQVRERATTVDLVASTD
jgi:hypothetical protein